MDDAAVELIVRRGFDPVYGARLLKRIVQNRVETPVARKIIGGEVAEGGVVRVGVDDNGLTVKG